MGRPRVYNEPRVTTAVRLSPALRDQLHEAAGDQGVSVNQLIVRAMSEYLGKLAHARSGARSAS